MPPIARWPILAVWMAYPFAAGLDYITGGDEASSKTLSSLERGLPIWVFAVLYLVGASLATVGFLGRWRLVAIGGLHVLGSSFVTVAISLFIDYIGHDIGDGFRVPVLFLMIGVSYWSAAVGYILQGRVHE